MHSWKYCVQWYLLSRWVFLPSGVTSWNLKRAQWVSTPGRRCGPSARGLADRLLHGRWSESAPLRRPVGGPARETADRRAPSECHRISLMPQCDLRHLFAFISEGTFHAWKTPQLRTKFCSSFSFPCSSASPSNWCLINVSTTDSCYFSSCCECHMVGIFDWGVSFRRLLW